MQPLSRGVLTWHSQPTTQKRLRNFERWLCHKFQVLLRLQSTDTGLYVHVLLLLMYCRWLPYQVCFYHVNATIDNLPFVQSKAFVTQVMHADISYLHIVFFRFLFPNL